MALRECSECGGKVSTEADACPHCGAKQEAISGRKKGSPLKVCLLIVLLVIGGCIVVMESFFGRTGNSNGRSDDVIQIERELREHTRQNPQQEWIEDQARLIRDLEGLMRKDVPDDLTALRRMGASKEQIAVSYLNVLMAKRYEEAENDLKKSKVHQTRRDAMQALLLKQTRIESWIAEFRSVRDSEGAKVKLALPHSNVTASNKDKPAGLVRQGSVMYETLSELKKGDLVLFSGVFMPDKTNFLLEDSWTESGSMDQPDYIIRFDSIRRLSKSELDKRAEEFAAWQERERKRLIAEFRDKKDELLAKWRSQYDSGKYEAVLDESEKYLVSADEDLKALYERAHQRQAEINKLREIKRLLADLQEIPDTDIEKLTSTYKRLQELVPDNEEYKKKHGKFAAKLAKKQRREMIERQFSAWSGSHRNLEKVIKKGMHNPGSYEHVKTTYRDMGDHLIVETTFRGTNKFGGVVKNSVTATVGLDGKIIKIW